MMQKKRISLNVQGIVQGVGFRPFLHRLAEEYQLSGWARNTSGGVEAELEGSEDGLNAFVRELQESAPPLSAVEKISASFLPNLRNYKGFEIRESGENRESTLVSPDISICPACGKELYTPSDRRFRYAFINCTDCGPRYTIVKSLPYDRGRTSMQSFAMCPECSAEYGDIRNRRYHAQPDCCPDCGPQMYYLDGEGKPVEGDPFALAQRTLAEGGIVAIKGIGGIHLACDGENEGAVLRLRRRKNRPEKPLALLCHSMDEVLRIAEPSGEEKKLLLSPRRPIVLVKKKMVSAPEWKPSSEQQAGAFKAVSFSERLGIMLPYTPIHLMLSDGTFGGPGVLVMTSANRPGCPVLIREEEALSVLSGIADGYLFHNRPIENRCDDSVVMEWKGEPYFLRRSRGYAPQPLSAKRDVSGIYAYGAEQKGSFALGKGRHVFLNPHIGDLKHLEAAEHFQEAMETYERLFDTFPRILVCDLHPDYVSARAAMKRLEMLSGAGSAASEAEERSPAGVSLIKVQHHWAHMASCMEDNGLDEPVFGIVWDGTGLGTDGTIWGGEFLEGDFSDFRRLGSIRPIALPGGDRAVKEIGRTALSLLLDAGVPTECVPLPEEKRRALTALLNSPLSVSACPNASSIGRLFDGVCALLLQKREITFDGQGGMLVEACAPKKAEIERMQTESPYPLQFYEENGVRMFDTRPMIRALWKELSDSREDESCSHIAWRFMETLCRMAADQCRELNTKRLPVVLSGGVFQNSFLLRRVTELLKKEGFTVYCHKRVSAGDEGISLGQLAVAREYLAEREQPAMQERLAVRKK